ncbi:MAG: protein-L-isoaspartate(D-aspartate) O-methyltransferase [Cytophagales bacterium]|nr:protein-L-isoaspartate(D-aspartate) O-methyltransferase [Cytophagales bacterium]
MGSWQYCILSTAYCLLLFCLLFFQISCNLNIDNYKEDSKSTATATAASLDTFPAFEWWRLEARKMVKTQISDRGVKDKALLEVMRNTPRHLFVPKELEKSAYIDSPLPIDEQQTISQPYIVALMTELLQLKGNEKVLEIGTGSGYQAAILAQLTGKVYTIELIKSLAESAKALLDRLGYENVIVKWGDGYKGWPEEAPFDCIIVTAAPETVPQELIKQLKNGGRLAIPVGVYFQELLLITKNKEGIKKESIIPVRFVPMVHPPAKNKN